MDVKEEYHDPDYPAVAVLIKQEPATDSEEVKIEKMKNIIHREFSNELDIKQNELTTIDQRMNTSRRMLHRLRYALVSSYYMEQKLQLSNSQIQDEIAAQLEPRTRSEVTTLLRDGQRQLHPSVRKLLGKKTVDIDDIFKSREPRNKTRKDYSAMIRARNYTIPEDATKSLRPEADMEAQPEPCSSTTSKPKKIPRHFDPKIVNVVTLDELTRNKMKHRYRIIIGNTSKYAPAASRADRSTHKWLLYVRGVDGNGDISMVIRGLTVTLHHSYAPHHTVHLDKPPYHISRRGWGEFPAKFELHFALPERNPPATVEHTIKLDRNYTGLQTLGAETIVDVWLYSTKEMLEYEFHENEVKQEPQTESIETQYAQTDSWLDFFSKETELDVDEMLIKQVKKENELTNDNYETNIINDYSVDIKKENEWNDREIENPSECIPNEILSHTTSPKKRIMKYMDPTTGKIYYLELDRNLDLSKVQEIVINSKGNTKTAKISPIKSNGLKSVRRTKKGVSLLKPEVKSQLKSEHSDKVKVNYTHIQNDHCYLRSDLMKSVNFTQRDVKINVKCVNTLYECLCVSVKRIAAMKVAVNYLLKKIPVISDMAADPDYLKYFPFTVEGDEKYWKLDFAKRRNIEWSRAKLINKILTEHFALKTEQVWRTKQILVYARLHGYFPVRKETERTDSETEWTALNDVEYSRNIQTDIRETYKAAGDVNSLTLFDENFYHEESIYIQDDSNTSDDILDVTNDVPMIKNELTEPGTEHLEVLPVDNDQDRLRFMFVERVGAHIGIDLRNEDVGNGFCYSAVHAVMLSAVKNFAEEVIRSALAAKQSREATQGLPSIWTRWNSTRSAPSIRARDIHACANVSPRLRTLTAHSRAATKRAHHPI